MRPRLTELRPVPSTLRTAAKLACVNVSTDVSMIRHIPRDRSTPRDQTYFCTCMSLNASPRTRHGYKRLHARQGARGLALWPTPRGRGTATMLRVCKCVLRSPGLELKADRKLVRVFFLAGRRLAGSANHAAPRVRSWRFRGAEDPGLPWVPHRGTYGRAARMAPKLKTKKDQFTEKTECPRRAADVAFLALLMPFGVLALTI